MEELKFIISDDYNLKEDEREIAEELYRKCFVNIYGPDLFDSFLNIANLKTNEVPKKRKAKRFSDNYNRGKKALESVSKNKSLKLLSIYDDNNLIGVGRLREINTTEASVPDLVVTRARDDSRDVWEKGITFAEEYFRDHDFERMFVEIPGKDPVLLGRAYDLGFIESIDAVPKGEFFTYLVNKELEREKDAKFGSSSK